MKNSLLIAIILVASLLKTSIGFVTQPRSLNSTLNSTITFSCEFPDVDIFIWRVNNTLYPATFAGSDMSSLVVVCNEHSGTSQCEFDFEGAETFMVGDSGVELECGARVNGTFIYSNPALLKLQGFLSNVTNLTVQSKTSTSITLSWVPPFSLDITGVDPDFTHTVEVYNITSGERSLVDTFPDITDSTFTFSLLNPDPSDMFEFIVTAVNDVGEGEPSKPVSGRFGDEEVTTTQKDIATSIPSTNEDRTTRSAISNESNSDTTIIVTSIASFVVGAAVGSVITLLIVLMVVCVRRHSQQSTALEAESGAIEMKSCDAYNVVAKKQKPAPPMYEEVNL